MKVTNPHPLQAAAHQYLMCLAMKITLRYQALKEATSPETAFIIHIYKQSRTTK